MKRIAVFVDGANFYFTQKNLGWTVDTTKLLDYCSEYGEITRATYYTGYNVNDGSQHRYLDFLEHIGFSLVTKPLKNIYSQATGRIFQKANLDVEIVVDMIDSIDSYDMAILISGDSDFQRVVQLLKSRGKEVAVISAVGNISTELRDETDYIDLATIRSSVEREFVEHELVA